METEIQKTESPLASAAALVAADGNLDVAKLEKLLEMHERWEATQAKKAYVVAMTAFKAGPPEIFKDQTVKYGTTSYNHASLSNVTTCINQSLSKHGLSASWETSQDGDTIKVTCKITHVMGHSESTCLPGKPDSSGSKNAIQAVGSTITYLERYTLLALTGLATHDQDNDGKDPGEKPVEIPQPTEQEHAVIDAICKKIPCPDGKRVDVKKLTAICYETQQHYPDDMAVVDKAAKWFSGMDRPEMFIPDNRTNFEKDYDMPGDEDSVPDEQQEALYRCTKCGLEFDTPKKAAECIH